MENTEVPWIFLSHSGEQKKFTRCLYDELVRVGHHPFFDQDADALPKGCHFPTRIVDACRRCKMGIVVLSHKYLESLWPMLELEQLTFHNQNSILIYPLFYCLKPADLSDHCNLRTWEKRWASKASTWPNRILQLSNSQISIDMSSWPKAVQMLKPQNGEVLQPDMEDHAYIQRIVSNICRTLPPPQHYWLGDQFKGMDRMQRNIEVLFRQQGIHDNGVIALGVYGVGGSGKTALCKSMANLYNKDFPGRSFWLEFPTEKKSDRKNEKKLVKEIKKVLENLTGINNEDLQKISRMEEAMGHLEKVLKTHKVFLAIDNVWDWNLENASQIVKEMKYISGSRVMVASRSKQALQLLLSKTVHHVPSMTKEEAVDALRYYSHASSFPHDVSQEDLRSLAQSCFYEEQCHPLVLKAVGNELKQVGARMKDWKDIISRLQAFRTTYAGDMDVEQNKGDTDVLEQSVLEVLDQSFVAIPPKLQKIFIDLVTCVPNRYSKSMSKQCEWLSMLHDRGDTPETMKYELTRLEYHGLLEMKESKETYTVHDLHKDVARRHILSTDAAYKYLVQGDLSQCQKKNLKYAIGRGLPVDHISGMGMESLKLVNCFPELEILHVYGALKVQRLSVQGMGSLRFLELQDCRVLKEIEGWKGAPKLVSIRLDGCSDLQKVGDFGNVHKLEELSMEWCYKLRTFPDVNGLSRLRTLNLRNCQGLKEIGGWKGAPNLVSIWLDGCYGLQKFGDIGDLHKLEELSMARCSEVLTFPDVNLSRLRTLNLSSCGNLRSMEGNECALTSLEELDLTCCSNLHRVPDLKNLAKLKVLKANGCPSLPKLGVSSLISLQVCNVVGGCLSVQCSPDARAVKVEELLLGPSRFHELPLIQITRDRPPVSAFVSLRVLELELHGKPNTWGNIVSLDVSGLISLENFSLDSFTSLDVINMGMAALTSLQTMKLKSLPSLRSLPQIAASLLDLTLVECTSLTDVSSLTSLASLQRLEMTQCSSLRDVSTFTSLASLQRLDLTQCSSLGDLPDLSHITTDLRIYGLRSRRADPAWLCPPLWVFDGGYYHRPRPRPQCRPGKTLCLNELAPVGNLNIHYDKLMGNI